jgi:hypothetical protein
MATLTKTISLLLVSILLLSFLSVQSCPMIPTPDQKVDVSANTCCGCCANSSTTSLPSDAAEQHQCPCKMSEKQPEQRSPAVVVTPYENKPEASLLALEIELISEDCSPKLIISLSHNFFLPCRDRPLFLLHSTLLI